MTIAVAQHLPPSLVLNADFRPLSYYPLSLWGWQDAIKAVFLDRVTILAEYDQEVRSPTFTMQLPSVVCLKAYVKPARHPAFTRFNVFLRDRFLYTNQRGWVESVERSVAAAFAAKVSPMALLSMIAASDRAALDVLLSKVEPIDPQLPLMIGVLSRLSMLESDVTLASTKNITSMSVASPATGWRPISARGSR